MNNQADILRDELEWQVEHNRQFLKAAKLVSDKFAEIDDEGWATEGMRIAIGKLNEAIADVEGGEQ